MPLLDHFRPPLSLIRPWSGFHAHWLSAIADQLNRDLLPPDYVAIPEVTVRGQIEVDVGTFQGAFQGDPQSSRVNGGAATEVWAPSTPLLSAPFEPLTEEYEVRVFDEIGGLNLRAAIELVSPANKDRPASRLAFAIKCASYLQRGVSLLIIDVLTERQANPHAELVDLLRLLPEFSWRSPTNLSAITYRTQPTRDVTRLLAWPEALQVGTPLPTMPLWLSEELCLPLALEDSYLATCKSLRIR
jgi:hypothetical protein